jgi:hypothetical protein
MTNPGESVIPESNDKDDEVLTTATPGAEALPLADESDEE